ncbi:MAG: putative transposase [Bacteroidetes bacterium]|jgi:REP element-mobilizing transposase RayT|nr:putative transposase [Bacteroidota bacterium]
MANTYTQLYVQIVFAVKNRENIISEKIRYELEKIMCTIVTDKQSRPLAVYCNPDHTHILVGLHPAISVSAMAEAIKSGSSGWINREKKFYGKFSWQSGYGAFTYSKSQIDSVVKYIQNQPEHHKHKTFREEYLEFLEKFNIRFDQQYLFDWFE